MSNQMFVLSYAVVVEVGRVTLDVLGSPKNVIIIISDHLEVYFILVGGAVDQVIHLRLDYWFV